MFGCLGLEVGKQNPCDRTLDLPFFFRCKLITCLRNHLLPIAQGKSCPTGFEATFAAVLALIYLIKEILRFEINLFEFSCQSKATDALLAKSAFVALDTFYLLSRWVAGRIPIKLS